MDKARKETDKRLRNLERRIKAVYAADPSLQRIQKAYDMYMRRVDALTADAYAAYKNAPLGEERDRLKKAYVDEVRRHTLDNKRYRNLVKEFARIMADVNQQALDLVNDEMDGIYALNYNQMATTCQKIGIKVNG